MLCLLTADEGEMAEAPPPDGSALCLACGLCCEGVLHTYAIVTPPDARRLRALGLKVESFDNHDGFRLPCPLYQDHRCSVYPPHLHACQSYRCEVLSQYLAGHLTLAEATALVDGARALLADPALATGQPFEQMRVSAREAEGRAGLLPTPEAQAAYAARQLAVEHLEIYLEQHFKK
jgi:hypothetical protein